MSLIVTVHKSKEQDSNFAVGQKIKEKGNTVGHYAFPDRVFVIKEINKTTGYITATYNGKEFHFHPMNVVAADEKEVAAGDGIGDCLSSAVDCMERAVKELYDAIENINYISRYKEYAGYKEVSQKASATLNKIANLHREAQAYVRELDGLRKVADKLSNGF